MTKVQQTGRQGLKWFLTPRPASEEMLSALGIVTRKTTVRVVFTTDPETNVIVAEVGDIAVYPNGRIVMWPRIDATPEQRRTLAGCAELAFQQKPTKAEGWKFCRSGDKTRWRCTILVPLKNDDPVARAIRAAMGTKWVTFSETRRLELHSEVGASR